MASAALVVAATALVGSVGLEGWCSSGGEGPTDDLRGSTKASAHEHGIGGGLRREGDASWDLLAEGFSSVLSV